MVLFGVLLGCCTLQNRSKTRNLQRLLYKTAVGMKLLVFGVLMVVICPFARGCRCSGGCDPAAASVSRFRVVKMVHHTRGVLRAMQQRGQAWEASPGYANQWGSKVVQDDRPKVAALACSARTIVAIVRDLHLA
eukprot:5353368-Amphidinium_carterae.1